MDREDQRPPDPDPRPARPGRSASLAVRLLAAFLALALLFGGIIGWGLYRSRRALDEVRLLDGSGSWISHGFDEVFPICRVTTPAA